MSASLPGPLVFVFPCRSQFGGRNNVCQMLQCSVRFTGRCFEWSLRAEGRVFEMEHRACFPWRVRIGAVALVVAMAKVKRSLKILLFFFFPLWHLLDRPHIDQEPHDDERGQDNYPQASQLPSCHPAIHPPHQPEGTVIAPIKTQSAKLNVMRHPTFSLSYSCYLLRFHGTTVR